LSITALEVVHHYNTWHSYLNEESS